MAAVTNHNEDRRGAHESGFVVRPSVTRTQRETVGRSTTDVLRRGRAWQLEVGSDERVRRRLREFGEGLNV